MLNTKIEPDYAQLVRDHLASHGCMAECIQVERIGHRLIIGLDGYPFGFIQVNITGEYMDEITYLYEAVDLLIDQAELQGILFFKSLKTTYHKQGVNITAISKYEFKVNSNTHKA